MPRIYLFYVAVLGLCCLTGPLAAADEIVFLNGDHLSGTVKEMAGGKLVFASAMAGEVTLDLTKVKSVVTTAPVTVELTDGKRVKSRLAAGAPAGQVVLADAPPAAPAPAPVMVAFTGIGRLNPPPPAWHGTLSAGATYFRGNSQTDAVTGAATAARRSDTDRITLNAGYANARQKDENADSFSTTQDAWYGEAKYDYYLTKKWYAYGDLRYEHDRIAKLDWRYTPNLGLGYQWFETPALNFSTEAGAGWVFERYEDSNQDNLDPDHPALRLAYHVDAAVNQYVSVFHNLEYLPSMNAVGNYTLRLDAGMKARLTSRFFVELKYQMNYNSDPPSDSVTTENMYMTSLGVEF